MYRIGIDVGGTFTDFTMIDEQAGTVHFHKVPSTPDDPSRAIAEGVGQMLENHAVPPGEVSHVGHGTTVATNLIIERKGAAVGLITTKGFRDILEIGRQTRPHLYDYSIGKPPVAVPRRYRLEVEGRMDAKGAVLEELNEEQVRQAARMFAAEGIQAVTICFLHAYRNPAHELRNAAIHA